MNVIIHVPHSSRQPRPNCRLYSLESIAEFLGCKLKELFEEQTE